MERRVVVTGESLITPIGISKNVILDNLIQRKSGIKQSKKDELLDDYLRAKVYGVINEEIDYQFTRNEKKTLSPVGYYAVQTVKELLQKCDLRDDFIRSGRIGVAFGSMQGSPNTLRSIFNELYTKEKIKLDNTAFLKSMPHTTASNIAKIFGIRGRLISSCTACTTSSQSIGFGYEAIKYGMQDAMICGGADEYDTMALMVFDNLLATSTNYNDTPHKTPRPFDNDRDGLVVSEGSGAVLLEEYEFAKKRGANILAEIIGFSCGNNGGSLILPEKPGVELTLRMGLENAKIANNEVDFISAHATATKIGDIIESQAIYEVYKDFPYVTGFKGHIGHTLSACGVIEMIFTLYLMEKGVIIPTLNLENIDEECNAIKHTPKVIEKDIKIASVLNYAFGGVNTSITLRKIQ